MRRREFISALAGALTCAVPVRAQQSSRFRVGTVSGQPRSVSFYLAFEQRMVELGYLEGRNFLFEHIHAFSLAVSNFECNSR